MAEIPAAHRPGPNDPCRDGDPHAWSHHHPAHSPVWIPTCQLCGVINGEAIAEEVQRLIDAAKPEGWESVAALQEAYTQTDRWLEDARQECKRLRAALIRIAAEIPRLDGLDDEERLAKGLEWIHQRACAALEPAPSAVEAPAPDGVSAIWCGKCRTLLGPSQLAAHNAEHHGAEAPAPDQTRDEASEVADRYMMATTAVHALGDISRDEPDLAVIYGEDGDDYIGEWATGIGYVNVRFPKATTRGLTGKEIAFYRTKVIETAGMVKPIIFADTAPDSGTPDTSKES